MKQDNDLFAKFNKHLQGTLVLYLTTKYESPPWAIHCVLPL